MNGFLNFYHFKTGVLLLSTLCLTRCMSSLSSEENNAKAQYYYEVGMDLLLDNKLPESIEALSAALELNSQRADIHMNLGLAYLKSGELERAQALLQKAHDLAPGAPEISNNLSALYLQKNNPQQALSWAEKALKVVTYSKPELAAANKTRALIQQKKYPEARPFLNRQLQRHARSCDLRLLSAQIHARNLDWDSAEGDTDSALRLCPSSPSVYLWSTYILSKQGRRQEGLERLQSMFKNLPRAEDQIDGQKMFKKLQNRLPLEEPHL